MNTRKTNDCKVLALAIQKGGVAKTTSSIALSAVLAQQGYRVLLVDNDPQHNATRSLLCNLREVDASIATIIDDMIHYRSFGKRKGIVPTEEDFDILPSDDSYAGIELQMISLMNREYFLKKYIEMIRDQYDYIIIDCPPNLGMLTINALVAADELLIPAQPQDYSATSLQQVLNTVQMVWQYPNPDLNVAGIFLTMYDKRRKEDRYMRKSIEIGFNNVKVFNVTIPYSVKVSEAARKRQSIIKYCEDGRVAEAYKKLVKEMMSNG